MASGIAPVSLLARARVHLARIRYRLLVLNLLVVAVPLIGISFARRHEGQLLAALEDDMIHQAQLVRALIAADAAPLDAREPTLVAAARDTRTRIRLLDATGAVRADSHRTGPPEGAEPPIPRILRDDSPTHAAEPPRPVEIASRPEIRRALAGRYGAATRLWGNQERVYLFIALPILDPAGAGHRGGLRDALDAGREAPAVRAAPLAHPGPAGGGAGHRAHLARARDLDRAAAGAP